MIYLCILWESATCHQYTTIGAFGNGAQLWKRGIRMGSNSNRNSERRNSLSQQHSLIDMTFWKTLTRMTLVERKMSRIMIGVYHTTNDTHTVFSTSIYIRNCIVSFVRETPSHWSLLLARRDVYWSLLSPAYVQSPFRLVPIIRYLVFPASCS